MTEKRLKGLADILGILLTPYSTNAHIHWSILLAKLLVLSCHKIGHLVCLGHIGWCNKNIIIEGKSSASFCCQFSAQVPDTFCNFYLVKNHKIGKNSTTTKAREKISTDLNPLNFRNILIEIWWNLKNKQILFNKISHRCLLTTKLFTRWKILICVALTSKAGIFVAQNCQWFC